VSDVTISRVRYGLVAPPRTFPKRWLLSEGRGVPHAGGTRLVGACGDRRNQSPTILSTWKGQSKPVIIDVDFEAAGEAQTYSYMCVVTQGSAFVQRTMH